MSFKFIILFFLCVTISCENLTHKVTLADKELLEEAQNNFEAIPKTLIDKAKNAKLIELGRKLYFEKSMSKSGTISCNSCHMLDKFGVDNEVTSPGHDGRRGGRNSPTVYNAALHFSQFWDGRAKDLEEQAIGPILNPIEHGMVSEKEVLSKISSKYKQSFIQAFKDKDSFTYKNIGSAIGAFEKTLLTPSRFDDYLRGDVHALTSGERKGLRTFIEVGCVSCHNGAALGGNSYQKLGEMNSYETSDLGRYEVTKDEDDKYVFKVPSLRNITHTAPYLHNGSVDSLKKMIVIMGKHQLDEDLNEQQVSDIEEFLKSLEAKSLPKISSN
ncbi:c-type cytochrome [bacterium]|nr:c-type cytochrome [bacterium]